MFTFPAISTANTTDEQLQKIRDEMSEFQQATITQKDEEVLDILQACETLVRIQFYNRRVQLTEMVDRVTQKNRSRRYYEG
jgi:hypothetical protein